MCQNNKSGVYVIYYMLYFDHNLNYQILFQHIITIYLRVGDTFLILATLFSSVVVLGCF